MIMFDRGGMLSQYKKIIEVYSQQPTFQIMVALN